eukprot:Pompholyxophrys_punicea_v1_NODE_1634_length_609_cov_1.922801.p1 type:complete len:108 gc:universal NODE_1634_length_609_cov_1.922801:333-10(-)
MRELKQAKARVVFNYGKNREGYWGNAHFTEQLKNAVAMHKFLFPNIQAVFVLDNSSGHLAFSEDALVASHMNLHPGGKQPSLRDTVWKGVPQTIGQKGLLQVKAVFF